MPWSGAPTVSTQPKGTLGATVIIGATGPAELRAHLAALEGDPPANRAAKLKTSTAAILISALERAGATGLVPVGQSITVIMNASLLSDMQPGSVFQVGEWTVEVDTNCLLMGERSLQIEPRLMKLLAYLAAHPEQVISKQTIVSEVWREHFVADEAISVAIYELRKALGDDARNPRFIKTIRKAGFQLIAPVQIAPVVVAPEPEPIQAAPPAPSPRPRHGRRAVYLITALALIAAVVWVFLPRQRQLPRVAVLPFAYMAEDSRQAYFAAGMTETLITDLASHTDHRILPRGTVMRFQGGDRDMRAIGEALGVDLCIAGAIQVLEGRVTVTVQVVDTADESHLWARRYEKEIRDFSAIQEEISRDLIQYFGAAEPAPEGTGENLRADVYYSYLMGRRFLNEDTPAGAQKAINQFSLVTRNAPEYAPAHAGLAHCYAFYGHELDLRPAESARLARAAAQRALQLDERIAEAHLALAVLFFRERNLEAAGRSFEAALRLHPTSVTALSWQGLYLATRGRFPEARRRLKEACLLDPISGAPDEILAFILYLEGKNEASVARFEAAATRKSPDADTRTWLFLARHADADTATLERALARASTEEGYGFLTDALAPEAESALSAVVRAALAAALARDDLALTYLERALGAADPNLVYVGVLPTLGQVRKTPRFQRLLAGPPGNGP